MGLGRSLHLKPMVCSYNFQLLPKLHDISLTSQYPGNPVEEKIKHIAEELKSVLEIQMKVKANLYWATLATL